MKNVITMFAFMCINASKQSLWIDELDWFVDFISKPSISDMLNYLLETGYNLPLSYLMMYPIYRIVPYGELWILLPNIIITIISVFIMKKIGEKIGGDDYGFVTMCLTILSSTLINNGAFELRPYALLFFFSALTLYRYICKIENSNKKNNILYTISLLLLAYTHWFGCLCVVFYFIVDTYLCIIKKNKISYVLQYAIVGCLFLPWFILMMIKHTTNFSEYWAIKPTLATIDYILKFLLSRNMICFKIFILGLIIFVISKLLKMKKKYLKYILLCIGNIVFTISVIFIYSRYINPKVSLFVDRYFFCLIPFCIIITALPLYELLNLKISLKNKISTKEEKISKILMTILTISILIIVCWQNYYGLYLDYKSSVQPYREFSDILVNSPEVYQEDGAVITSDGIGYITYYFEKRGNTVPLNVYVGRNDIQQIIKDGKRIEVEDAKKEELLNYNVIYLLNVNRAFEKDFVNFIYKNFTLKEKVEGMFIYIFEKNN